jgi:succinoglycan biosynthesis protein ExoO
MTDISVIIPAYHASAHITRSVSSLLAQTIPDFEIVIASDDGEDYGALLKAQGITDPRIHVTTTGSIGSGASHARNCALDVASGRFIISMDADDAVVPHYLETMLPLAMESGAALTQVAFVDDAGGQALFNCAKPYDTGLLPFEDLLLANAHTYTCIAYDRTKIAARWNEDIPLLEDAIFLAECCNCLGKVMYHHTPLYTYYHRQDSHCNLPESARRFMDAGSIILNLVDQDKVCSGNAWLQDIIRRYIARNNHIEMAMEQAIADGKVKHYQQFIASNLDLLHTPLV